MDTNIDRQVKQYTKEEVYIVANKSCRALIKQWNENKFFSDSDQFADKSGLIPESIGLTSLMLLLVAFRDEKSFNAVFEGVEGHGLSNIINTSYKAITEWIKENGYDANPIVSSKATAGLFNNNGHSYVDSLTWVLSTSVLICFAEKAGIFRAYCPVSAETLNAAKTTLADSLTRMLDAQKEDGTWGFSSDSASHSDIYFTYAANTSLADVFDYIFGEITLVDDSFETSIFDELKSDLQKSLKYINSHYAEMDIQEICEERRNKIADWLIFNALPVLPDIATAEAAETYSYVLNQVNVSEFSGKNGKYNKSPYFNLYYAYYLIDMFVTSCADEYFKAKVITDEDNLNKFYDALQSSFKNNSVKSKKLADRYNYYVNIGRQADFINDYIERAVFASRMLMNDARCTGDPFWEDYKQSELKTVWTISQDDGKVALVDTFKVASDKLKDPSLLPMALRANAQYTYYITKRPDYMLDKLFGLIEDDQSKITGSMAIEGLWDQLSFSLSVTEKSIEGIIDYFDYLSKYYVTASSTEKSDSLIDRAVETKIKEVLSREIEQLVNEKVEKALLEFKEQLSTFVQPVSKVSEKNLDFIEKLPKLLRNQFKYMHDSPRPDGDEKQVLAYNIGEIFKEAAKCALLTSSVSVWGNRKDQTEFPKDDFLESFKGFSSITTGLLNDFVENNISFNTVLEKLPRKR